MAEGLAVTLTPEDPTLTVDVFVLPLRYFNNACLSAGVTSSSAVLCDKPANCILSSKTLSEIFKVFAKSFTVTDKIFPLII